MPPFVNTASGRAWSSLLCHFWLFRSNTGSSPRGTFSRPASVVVQYVVYLRTCVGREMLVKADVFLASGTKIVIHEMVVLEPKVY